MNPDELDEAYCIKNMPPHKVGCLINSIIARDKMNTNKIKSLLDERFEKIRSELWDKLKPRDHDSEFDKALDVAWVSYLNRIDCEVVDQDDIVEEFENLFNYSSRTRICVNLADIYSKRPGIFFQDTYVLVPKQLAEKAIILGGLPDEWSPETSNP